MCECALLSLVAQSGVGSGCPLAWTVVTQQWFCCSFGEWFRKRWANLLGPLHNLHKVYLTQTNLHTPQLIALPDMYMYMYYASPDIRMMLSYNLTAMVTVHSSGS